MPRQEKESKQKEKEFIPPQEISRETFIMELENRRSEALEHLLDGQGMALNGQKIQFEARRDLTSYDDLERKLEKVDDLGYAVKFFAAPEGLSFVYFPKDKMGFQGTLKGGEEK